MTVSKGLVRLGFDARKDFELLSENGVTTIKHWWSSKPQPSDADIQAASDAWKAEYEAQQYARKRKEAYEAAGCTIEALAIATFESVFDDESSAAVRLQVEREKIKAAIHKS